MGSAERPRGEPDAVSSGAVIGDLGDLGFAERLRTAGISLTLQRLVIARVLLSRPVHLTADQIWARAKDLMPEISRATVYNTIDLFERSGLLRRLIVDSDKVVFDSTTTPHHHYYDVGTGEVSDIPVGELEVLGLPNLPAGLELLEVDVVVRVRRRA